MEDMPENDEYPKEETTEVDQFYAYVEDYIVNEIKTNFKNTIPLEDCNLLDCFASDTMESITNNIRGIAENEIIYNFMLDEIRLSSRIGYSLCSSINRYSMECSKNRDFVKNRNKFDLRKFILIKIEELLLFIREKI